MKSTHDSKVSKANKYIDENLDKIAQSKYRLNYHFMPQTGWMNDPNGFVFFNGEYHLFYQFYPYAAEWGPMHWGHAKSPDGIRWSYLPVALAPSEEYDSDTTVGGHGCFSGSAIVKDDELYLAYTGHVDGREVKQTQNIAKSKDGIHFEKSSLNPVISDFPKEVTDDHRDPKVWEYNGKYYMIVGSKKDEKAKVTFYSSEDLYNWEYLGIVAESNGLQGDMWECPDLFNVDNQDILIVSPMYGPKNSSPLYIVGNLDYELAKFEQKYDEILDYGKEFYAPQTLVDDQGRRVLIGWMDMWFSEMPSNSDGWSGAMTVARQLSFKNGMLYQEPLKEIENLRTNKVSRTQEIVQKNNPISLTSTDANDLNLKIDLEKSQTSKFDLYLKANKDLTEYIKVSFDLDNKEIIIDRSLALEGEKTPVVAPIKTLEKELNIRILSDVNSLEIFINNGETVITNRIYSSEDCNSLLIKTEESLFVDSLEMWELGSIW